jgi:hypothetical protein
VTATIENQSNWLSSSKSNRYFQACGIIRRDAEFVGNPACEDAMRGLSLLCCKASSGKLLRDHLGGLRRAALGPAAWGLRQTLFEEVEPVVHADFIRRLSAFHERLLPVD